MVLTESNKELKKGDKAVEFNLKGVDNNEYTLQRLKGKKATLVVFICNHCPYVQPKINELSRIAADFKGDLSVIAISSNDARTYPEDSFLKMQEVAMEKKITFHYLYDESQDVAKAYGAACTPDPFLFNEHLELIHHGRIDDTHGSEPPHVHELYEAIKQYLETGKITQKEKPSMGCSIKWRR